MCHLSPTITTFPFCLFHFSPSLPFSVVSSSFLFSFPVFSFFFFLSVCKHDRPSCIVRHSAVWLFRPTHLVSSPSNPPRSPQGRRSSDDSLRLCRRIAADRSPSHQDSFGLPGCLVGWLAGWLVGQHPPFRHHWLNIAAWRRRACHRTLRFLSANAPSPFPLPARTREKL